MNIILWESTIFQWKKPLTILVIPTLRLEFPNEIATSTKAVDPYLSQSASNFLAIFVGFMGWPIHHFQAPGELTRSFTSGGGAEARSARPGAEGFGISVEPWKVRIRHHPSMGLEFLHANRKTRVWRTISRVPRLLHGFYVEFRSWSVEGRGSWSFGTLQLSFHQLGKSLGSSFREGSPLLSLQLSGRREPREREPQRHGDERPGDAVG